MHLPYSPQLPISTLAACFNKTTTTYKFYWFLALLQAVEEGKEEVSKRELFAGMVAHAWYTVNYFHLSFGKWDLIQEAIGRLTSLESLTVEVDRATVVDRLVRSDRPETKGLLQHFDRNVPHWFLSPWYPSRPGEKESERQRRIYASSQAMGSEALYALYPNHIRFNSNWIPYVVENVGVLKSYCYWHLAVFLQAKNPNVPDIPNKLIKPPHRSSLTRQRTHFWDLILNEYETVPCIYTGKPLRVGSYAVEHFVPYSFVSHDLIWNLLPADPSFNSRKGNKLPPLERYFRSFFSVQQQAYAFIREKSPRNQFLEDYWTIFPYELPALQEQPFYEVIQPLVSIAARNGFEFMDGGVGK
ncbi:MAG: HNH endonuclease domain-containing protein [Spirosomataceae bacterium]